jgi:hypothetical protein
MTRMQDIAVGICPDDVRTVTVKTRCVDGVDLYTLEPKPMDGRKF